MSPPFPTAKKIVVTLPTYNEAANVERLTRALLDCDPRIHVLVADDDSPDGTWKLVAAMARTEPRVALLHRTTDRGRGRAGIAAFRVALDLGADVVVEMDADFSHRPEHVPEMLRVLENADLVIGSRLVAGGADEGRGKHRVAITALSTAYNRMLLGVTIRDCNSGFRVYRRALLESLTLETMVAVGPEIVPEVLIRAHRRGARIVEHPITFVERAAGESNLTFAKLLKVLRFSLFLWWRSRTGRLFDPVQKATAS
jgi:dolichol-phosphate mannosyltransferase